MTRRTARRSVVEVKELDLYDSQFLPGAAEEAYETGTITYLVGGDGVRYAAIVPVAIAEHAERLRAETEAADAELSGRS